MGSENISPLRGAHRRLTRIRICDAAKELFFVVGYRETRVEEIASKAGVSRSTLYAHYPDKDAILATIADNYAVGLTLLVEGLPGPSPTRAEIGIWIDGLASFIKRERVPTILVVELADGDDAPMSIRKIGDELLLALAERVPAFARASQPGPGQNLARAWADTVFRELGWSCLRLARADSAIGESALQVAGDIFHYFVSEQYRERR